MSFKLVINFFELSASKAYWEQVG